MTPTLSRAISLLPCPKCNGEGQLAWRLTQRTGNLNYTTSNTIPCDVCAGDGLNPNLPPHVLWTVHNPETVK